MQKSPQHDDHARQPTRQATAFQHLSHMYVMRQLELLAQFHHLSELLDVDLEADTLDAITLTAHHFTINTEAWKKVCDDLAVDPNEDLEDLPGFSQLQRYEPLLADLASPNSQTTCVAMIEPDHASLTVYEMANAMQIAMSDWS